MRRIITMLALLVAISAGAYFVVKKEEGNRGGAMDTRDREFAVKDMEKVYKIVLDRKDGIKHVFKRNNSGRWTINDQYLVSKYAMPYLIQTLRDVRIQHIPPSNSVRNIMDGINRVGIKVELFDKSDKKIKGYYVGGETAMGGGTYYLMEGFSQPYVMEVPALDGSVRWRFAQNIELWRDRVVIDEPLDKIEALSIEFHKDQKSSFSITKDGGTYAVAPLSKYQKPTNRTLDQNRVKGYLTAYESIGAEGFDNQNAKRDSISNLIPFATIRIKRSDGIDKEMDLFPFNELYDPDQNIDEVKMSKLVERYFLNSSSGDFAVVQQRVIGKLLRPYSFFFE